MDQLGIDPSHDVTEQVITADTLASEVHELQHSMRQMERSDAEMAAMISHPTEHGLDEDDVRELKLALEENVGVMNRKRELLAKLTRALEEALQASGLVLDPETRHAEQTAPPLASPAPGVPAYDGQPSHTASHMDQTENGDGLYL